MVTEPTRVTKDTKTLIDLIITNDKKSILDVTVTPSIADHHEVGCTINIKKAKKIKTHFITCRNKSSYSQDLLLEQLSDNLPLFNNILKTDDVTNQVNIFTTTFLDSLDKISPLRTIKMKRPPVKWMTDTIKHEIAKRDTLKLKAKQNSNQLQIYKEQRTKVRNIISKAKAVSYHAELKEARSNPKETWNIIQKIVPYQPRMKKPQIEHSVPAANSFNQFFASVGETVYKEVRQNSSSALTSAILSPDHKSQTPKIQHQKWSPEPTTEASIERIIYSLKNTKSTGADNISLQHIKDSLPVTLKYITVIINTSIVTNSFPEQWKHAEIFLIHKSGDPTEPANFRPISLLPTLSKILEKVVANQLILYLESENLLNKHQFAYRPRTSTEDALLNITEAAYKGIDNGDITLLVLLDLSKAFDSVNHNILTDKLDSLNINTSWFKNYLSNRSQSVKLDKIRSQPLPITFGVPQGSILGPLLFLIFVNNITTALPPHEANLIMYADDLQVVLTGKPKELKTIVSRTETLLKNIKHWYDSIGLKVNPDKTKWIIIGSKHNTCNIPDDITISFDGKSIPISEKVKSLGIWLDKNLTFVHQINTMRSKLNGTLICLNKTKHNLNNKSLLLTVYALIFSNVNYCQAIWGKCSQENLDKIQKCINFAAKVASNGTHKKSDHVTPLLKDLQWLRINKRIDIREAVCVYKSIHNYSNAQCLQTTTRGEQLSLPRALRSDDTLHVEFRKTKMGQNAVSISGPKIWNTIPVDIRDAENLACFKRKLVVHSLEQEYS